MIKPGTRSLSLRGDSLPSSKREWQFACRYFAPFLPPFPPRIGKYSRRQQQPDGEIIPHIVRREFALNHAQAAPERWRSSHHFDKRANRQNDYGADLQANEPSQTLPKVISLFTVAAGKMGLRGLECKEFHGTELNERHACPTRCATHFSSAAWPSGRRGFTPAACSASIVSTGSHCRRLP